MPARVVLTSCKSVGKNRGNDMTAYSKGTLDVGKAKDLLNEGYYRYEITQMLGTPKQWIYDVLPKGHKHSHWSERELERMRNLRVRGKTNKEIAKALNRTEAGVKMRVRRCRRAMLNDNDYKIALYSINLAMKCGAPNVITALKMVRKTRTFDRIKEAYLECNLM